MTGVATRVIAVGISLVAASDTGMEIKIRATSRKTGTEILVQMDLVLVSIILRFPF